MGKNKTSDIHDALVAIAHATVVTAVAKPKAEAIELRGD